MIIFNDTIRWNSGCKIIESTPMLCYQIYDFCVVNHKTIYKSKNHKDDNRLVLKNNFILIK